MKDTHRSNRSSIVRELRARRPRSRLLRGSLLAFGFLGVWSFLSGAVDPGDLFTERRMENLRRFLTEDALPLPLREGQGASGFFAWAGDLLLGVGGKGLVATAWISIAAIVLAAFLGLLLSPLGARTLMTCDPFARTDARNRDACGIGWRALTVATRSVCVLLRATPEYVLAFLLLAMLGSSAWPAVLALGFHNAGILGRLGADTIENLDRAPLRGLAALGASRRAIAVTALPPLGIGRYLLYVFYRFETCVREATVLGFLGIVSLGYFVQDARARQSVDEMLFLVALGGLLVALADVGSLLARRHLRLADT